MKVGNLVRNLLNKRIGIVTEVDALLSDNDHDHVRVWVRWIGNCDWDLHFPEDLEVLNESR